MPEENTSIEPKKRGRPKGKKSGYTKSEKAIDRYAIMKGTDASEENVRMVGLSRDLLKLPKVDIKNMDAVKNRIDLYLEMCEARGFRPTVTGIALALKVNIRTIKRWASGERRAGTEMNEYMADLYTMLDFVYENLALTAKTNPAVHIFLLKNHFGYKDEQEITIQDNNTVDVNDLINNAKMLPDNVIEAQIEEIDDTEDSNDTD